MEQGRLYLWKESYAEGASTKASNTIGLSEIPETIL